MNEKQAERSRVALAVAIVKAGSLRRLAAKANIDKSRLHRVKSGVSDLTLEEALKIEDAVKVSANDLRPDIARRITFRRFGRNKKPPHESAPSLTDAERVTARAAIGRAIDIAGGTLKWLSAKTKISKTRLCNCHSGRVDLTVDEAVAIHRATGLPVDILRPDFARKFRAALRGKVGRSKSKPRNNGRQQHGEA